MGVREEESNFLLTKKVHIHSMLTHNSEICEDRLGDLIIPILNMWELRFTKVKPLAQISIAHERQSWNSSPCLCLPPIRQGLHNTHKVLQMNHRKCQSFQQIVILAVQYPPPDFLGLQSPGYMITATIHGKKGRSQNHTVRFNQE